MAKRIRVAINGFGRIGRVTTRLLWGMPEFELVAINDMSPLEQSTHLLRFDSVHGPWKHDVKADKQGITIDGTPVKVTSLRDPVELPWKSLGVDLVFESTGIFTGWDGASKHLTAGAKKVIVSAPCKDAEKIRTFVMGINHDQYDPQRDQVVSNASCTTNCLAPLVKVLNDKLKITRGLMTTVHSYTNDQRVLDLGHEDFRRMRAAAINMIPTTTGAAKAVTLVIPELKGKLTGISIRVPTPNVSLVDFVADVQKSTTVEEVNEAFVSAAASGPLKGVLAATDLPLVSSDFNGSTFSSTVDLQSTMVMDGTMVKVLSWYDNETGFSRRMLDLASWIGQRL